MLSESQILDAELLSAFVAFAETKNFTHAARRVHLSQPALFERVRRLAEHLDCKLYERTGRDVRLTDAGVSLLDFARDSLARTERFVGALRGETAEAPLALASGEGAYLYVLTHAIARLSAAQRRSLSLLTLGARDAIEAVRGGQVHAAFTVADVLPAGLVGEEILRTPVCAALPARHRLARARELRVRDLASERLILATNGRLYRDLVARFVSMRGHTLAAPLEADGWPLMLAFVRAGLGVAVVNGICEPPRGVTLRPIRELGVVAYKLVRRRDREPSATLTALVDAIHSSRRSK